MRLKRDILEIASLLLIMNACGLADKIIFIVVSKYNGKIIYPSPIYSNSNFDN